MCKIPKVDTSAIYEAQLAQQQQLQEQLNKNNVLLSNQEVARTTSEKESKKRNISSLRVPIKNQTSTTIGVNSDDTSVGLNIPV